MSNDINTPTVFAGKILPGKQASTLCIPTAYQVKTCLEDPGETSGYPLQFTLPPKIQLQCFLLEMQTQMILSVSRVNRFSINSINSGYDILMQILPKIQSQYKSLGWDFNWDIVAGIPGDADECNITISC